MFCIASVQFAWGLGVYLSAVAHCAYLHFVSAHIPEDILVGLYIGHSSMTLSSVRSFCDS